MGDTRGPSLLVFDPHAQARQSVEEVARGRWAANVATSPVQALTLLDGAREIRGAILVLAAEDVEDAGLELLLAIRLLHPAVRALALAEPNSPSSLVNTIHALGAEYACKPVRPETVDAFVSRLMANDRELVLGAIIAGIARRRSLTKVEVEIVTLVCREARASRTEIADHLGITENTAKTHARNLLRKCGQNALSGVRDVVHAELRARMTRQL